MSAREDLIWRLTTKGETPLSEKWATRQVDNAIAEALASILEGEAVRLALFEEELERSRRLRMAWESARETRIKLRDRVAELETAAEKVALFCAQRAEYVTNLRQHGSSDEDYYRWSGHAEARRQLSQRLGLPVAWPLGDGESAPAPARQQEDPHDSPLHHDYLTPHDLPTQQGGGH